MLLTYAVLGWFIGHQDTRWPMVILVFTNLLNIVLDVLFIVVLDWKSAGAARHPVRRIRRLCARPVAGEPAHPLPLAAGRRAEDDLRLASYRELLDSNRFLFIRTVCLLFSFAFFTAMSTRLGEATLAANTIMLNLLLLAAYGLDGFAYAAEGLAGNAAGAGDLARFRRACAPAGTGSGNRRPAEPGVPAGGTVAVSRLHRPCRVQQPAARLPPLAGGHAAGGGTFLPAGRRVHRGRAGRYMMHSMVLSLLLVYLPLVACCRPGQPRPVAGLLAFNGARGITLYLATTTASGLAGRARRLAGLADSPAMY